jgi:hypothetical protein
MKAESWTVLLLFLAIIAISLWISLASNNYAFENTHQTEGFDIGNVASYQDDSIPIQLVNASESSSVSDNSTQCQRLGNFPGGGLFCSPDTNTDNIDIYSTATGDLASTNSSGLNNSRGPLALNSDMVHLLSTRGNNAVGRSA